MTFRKVILSLAVLLLAPVPLALAQGTYTQIDYPGEPDTITLGINAAGDIVGSFWNGGRDRGGFLLSGSVYTSILYPGAERTAPSGINDAGQIVGSTFQPTVGFEYDIGTPGVTTIQYPNVAETFPTAINDAGTVAGYFYVKNRVSTAGFELINSSYRQVTGSGMSSLYVWGISGAGELAGFGYNTLGMVTDFVFPSTGFEQVTIPNLENAIVFGINPQGSALIGYATLPSGTNIGFVSRDGRVTALQFPGATETYAQGINAAGEVVGYFADASSHFHGFTWTPPADAAKK